MFLPPVPANVFATSSSNSSVSASGDYTYTVPAGTASGSVLYDRIKISETLTAGTTTVTWITYSVDVEIHVP